MKTFDQRLQEYAEAYRRNEAKVVSDLERKLASYEKVVNAAREEARRHAFHMQHSYCIPQCACACEVCQAIHELDKGEHQ